MVILFIFHLIFFYVSYSQFNPFTVDGIAALAEVTVAMNLHHLTLSCDELTLSVCGVSEETGLSLTFYDVRVFMHQVTISPVHIRCVYSGTSEVCITIMESHFRINPAWLCCEWVLL